MAYMKNLVGKRFGRLTVIEFSHKEVNPSRTTNYWKCKCTCGNTAIVNTSNLCTGNTKSCGCYKKELLVKKKTNRFVFPVLDTLDVTRCEEFWKLKEEFKEFVEAIEEYDNCEGFGNEEKKNHLLEEFFDLVQVSVNLIDMLDISSLDKQEAYRIHLLKMLSRGWDIKTYV